MKLTKAQFLETYETMLIANYPWANDKAKLERYMGVVKLTVEFRSTQWNHTGEIVTAAWRAIGGKGVPSLKALRALPAE